MSNNLVLIDQQKQTNSNPNHIQQLYQKENNNTMNTDSSPTQVKEDNNVILVQFQSYNGTYIEQKLTLPVATSASQLQILLNKLLKNESVLPYTFTIDDLEIDSSIQSDYLNKIKNNSGIEYEKLHTILYFPQETYQVKPVTRCSGSIEGHTEAILSVKFSPNGAELATGSGDTTVRLWDLNTLTPKYVLKGHTNWVLVVEWSPDASILASGSMDNTIRLWDPKTGKQKGKEMRGHTKWITALSFEPYHLNPNNPRLVSASKDCTIRIWDIKTQAILFSFSQHTHSITGCKWGVGHLGYSQGVIYTCSQDRMVKIWDPNTKKLINTLKGHAHWINSIALNTDIVLRRGKFDHKGQPINDINQSKIKKLCIVKKKIEEVLEVGMTGAFSTNNTEQNSNLIKGEKIITGSDDFSLFVWLPFYSLDPIHKLHSHRQLVNHVVFSPNGRYISSASFDKTVKIWDAKTGKNLKNLRAHVGAVYQLCWSSDSRLLMSCSKDSTCKIWTKNGELKANLSGHRDEVYAVDWTPCGTYAASGGKDRILKM